VYIIVIICNEKILIFQECHEGRSANSKITVYANFNKKYRRKRDFPVINVLYLYYYFCYKCNNTVTF